MGMKNKAIGIIVVIVVLVLGYSIYTQRASFFSQEKESNQVPPTSFDSTALGLTAEEVEVLQQSETGQSVEESRRRFELVRSIAQSAPYLDITRCVTAKPVVFKVTQGESFSLRNDDTVEHTIIRLTGEQFIVPAGGTIDISPDFQKVPGVYGYRCDNGSQNAGLFFVTE